MKHKSAEQLLVPPSPNELMAPSATSAMIPTPATSAQTQHRKKPHVLPPLADKRKSSVDWLPRGSPPPAWRRSSIEDNLLGEDMGSDKPAVRVIRCPDAAPGPTSAPEGLRSSKYAPLEPIKRQPRTV